MTKALFSGKDSLNTSFVVLVTLAVTLMLLDGLTRWIHPVRSSLSLLVYPIELIADLPVRATNSLANAFVVRDHLRDKNRSLTVKVRDLEAKLIQYESMNAENNRLRELLNSTKKIPYQTKSARILTVSHDPFQKLVSIDAGSLDGIAVGVPFIDSSGIMGQVTRVYPGYSIGLMITDSNHAIPVQVLRNGLRTIALGNAQSGKLQLQHIPPNSDIKIGDLLVTSGLGLRFPADFPVATVEKITHKAGSPFSNIDALPVARLDTSREILLILPHHNGEAIEPGKFQLKMSHGS